MTPPTTENPLPGETGTRDWFCLRSQPKHEHIAARHLRKIQEVEVFLPRIRFRRATRRGAVWATEALFPNYLFARFDWRTQLRQVRHAHGVTGVIHFGDQWPTVPEALMEELRARFNDQELRVIGQEIQPGDEVQITGGVLHGLNAVITQVLPARERVTVLLDLLGRQTTAEVSRESLVSRGERRELLP